MRKALLIFAAVIIFLFMLLPELVIPPIQIGFHLVFGWIGFLKRTLPQVTLNISAVGLALICVVLIILGTHWFCSWLYRQVRRNTAAQGQDWTWRWTWGIGFATVFLFSTSIAITGICHQVTWWIRSKEPLYAPRFERIQNINDMKQQSLQIIMTAEDNHWNWQETQTDLARESVFSDRRFSVENWHRLLVPGTNGELLAAFVFHRDPSKRAKAGFGLISRESHEIFPIAKLPEELARFDLQQENLYTTSPAR